MSIYDQIADAVSQVRCEVRSGNDINDSVRERTKGFSKEAVQRVIEEVNVHEFLDVLNSEGDKSRHFPVADPQVVFTKTAELAVHDSDLIQGGEIPNLDFYELEKTGRVRGLGELPFTESKRKPISDEQAASYILGRKEVLEKKAELYFDAMSQCDDIILENMQKIAGDIYCDQEKADELFGNVIIKYDYDKLIPFVNSLRKLAKLEKVSCKAEDFNVYDDSNKNVQLFDQMIRAFEKRCALNELREGLKKKACRVKELVKSVIDDRTKDPLEKEAIGRMWLPAILGSFRKPRKTPRDLVGPMAPSDYELERQRELPVRERSFEGKVETFRRAREAGREAKTEAKLDEIISGKKPGLVKKTLGGISGIGKGFGAALESRKKYKPIPLTKTVIDYARAAFRPGDVSAVEKELEKETEIGAKYEQKFKQKSVIEDLIEDDEMLKEQDPRVLAQLFETLVKIAPYVATNKEITRSFLRELSAQAEPTIDAYSATQLMKLDKLMGGEKVEIKLD